MQGTEVDQPVRKIARIKAMAEQSDQLRAALAELELHTRQERGCVEFAFFQAISDQSKFVLLEQFASPAAFQAHMELPHTRAFFAAKLVESVSAVDVPALT